MSALNKKILYLLCCLLIAAVTAGCSSSSDVSKEPVQKENIKLISDDDKPYIGFLLDTLKQERWYKDKAIFEERIKELGGEVKTLAANGLDDVQIKQAELLIEEGVDVLVVVPHDATLSAKIVEIAHKAGVKVISYDRLIKTADLDYYISFDNVKVGELQASEILKRTASGNFAYVGGSETDNNAILFRQGTIKVLQPLIDSGKIKLIFDEYTMDWKAEIAKENMQKALKENGNQIHAVIAANDTTAEGVIESLSSVGLAGTVPVSGQDAELAAIHRIIKGEQTMTVYKPISIIANKAAELAIKVVNGDQIKIDKTIKNGQVETPSILLEPITVTKENIRDTVIKDGYLTEIDVFAK